MVSSLGLPAQEHSRWSEHQLNNHIGTVRWILCPKANKNCWVPQSICSLMSLPNCVIPGSNLHSANPGGCPCKRSDCCFSAFSMKSWVNQHYERFAQMCTACTKCLGWDGTPKASILSCQGVLKSISPPLAICDCKVAILITEKPTCLSPSILVQNNIVLLFFCSWRGMHWGWRSDGGFVISSAILLCFLLFV